MGSYFEKGEKLLLFRVNLNVKKDAIERHFDTLKEYGYCWFGKIGRTPLDDKVQDILAQDHPHMLLYTKKKLFVCGVDKMAHEKPSDGFPNYYKRELFSKDMNPRFYIRILSMKEIPVDELQNMFVITTAKTAEETLPKAKATFMFLVYGQKPIIEKKTKRKKEKKIIVNPRFCKYQLDGICNNHRCVNYEYECFHPELCTKRKG